MSTKISMAVMHCTVNQPKLVVSLGIKVRDALYSTAGAALYGTPPVNSTTFAGQVTAANTTQGNLTERTRGTTATTGRDTAVETLFNSLTTLILYVNGLYRGNKTNLELSGFDISNDPQPHPIPDEPVIKKIKDGPVAHSAKILLAKTTSTLNRKRERYTYTVQMAATDVEASFATVLTVTSMRKLIVPGLTRGKEVFLRVARSNAAGQSTFSAAIGFVPQ